MLGINKGKNDLMDAEAMGQLKTMPSTKGQIIEKDLSKEVIDNPQDFQAAIGHAQMAGQDYVEVSDRMFSYLVKNSATEYLTYGNPGVKVFKEGTRDKIVEFESLNPDEQVRRKLGKQ
jgi:hypothetical protein